MQTHYRDFIAEKDFQAGVRLWKEVGWLDKGEEEWFRHFIEGSHGMVAEVDGSIECLVLMTPGTMRYLNTELPLAAVTGVTTGRTARRKGLARSLLARALAREARNGAALSALGIFDQGYYDGLGFGNGSYTVRVRFDPAQLKVPPCERVPVRLSADDWAEMHRVRLERYAGHGRVNLLPPGMTRSDGLDREKSFGLGFRDGPNGELTHYLWCFRPGGDKLDVELVYQRPGQLRELLGALKNQAEQVVSVNLREPPGIMMQDLLERPGRMMMLTKGGKHEVRISCGAFWQARILNLETCLKAVSTDRGPLSFNLRLHDPASSYIEETGWHGLAGQYVVRLGRRSTCRPGHEPGLPTLEVSVGAFTRMWLGVCSASGLHVTDDLHGPDDLLTRLDAMFCLPRPQPDWDF